MGIEIYLILLINKEEEEREVAPTAGWGRWRADRQIL
jgi:hypothetical protein